MPESEVLLAFFCASVILGLTPGPDIIFVLTQSALHGAAAGFATTCGLLTGLLAQTAAVALGLAVIFQTSPLAFNLLRCAGAAYLCWLAWQELRAGAAPASPGKGSFAGLFPLYRRGIFMNVTNPKVCIFFLAFLPQFCNPAAGRVDVQIMALGGLFLLATALVFFPAAALGGRLAACFGSSQRGQLALHRAAALVFLGLACALFFTGGAA